MIKIIKFIVTSLLVMVAMQSCSPNSITVKTVEFGEVIRVRSVIDPEIVKSNDTIVLVENVRGAGPSSYNFFGVYTGRMPLNEVKRANTKEGVKFEVKRNFIKAVVIK